jgi:hypothetical protein
MRRAWSSRRVLLLGLGNDWLSVVTAAPRVRRCIVRFLRWNSEGKPVLAAWSPPREHLSGSEGVNRNVPRPEPRERSRSGRRLPPPYRPRLADESDDAQPGGLHVLEVSSAEQRRPVLHHRITLTEPPQAVCNRSHGCILKSAREPKMKTPE